MSSRPAAAQAQAEEWDADYGLYKVSPLLDWSEAQVWQYIRARGLPYNALHDRQYPSIGCSPCTRAIQPGESAARRTLVVGAIGVARMRPASKTSDRGARRRDALGPRMDYLPIFLRVEARPVVVVGGGEVALRKAQWLLKAGAQVTVVAPELHARARPLRRQCATSRTAPPPSPRNSSKVPSRWSRPPMSAR